MDYRFKKKYQLTMKVGIRAEDEESAMEHAESLVDTIKNQDFKDLMKSDYGGGVIFQLEGERVIDSFFCA